MGISKKIDDYIYPLPTEGEAVEIPAPSKDKLVITINNDSESIERWKKSIVSEDHSRVTFLLCEKKFPENYYELIKNHKNLIAIPKAQSHFIIKNYIDEKIKAKEVEEIRKTYEEELINVHLMKESFMSNITHELRTPLNTILGYSEIASEDLKSDDYDCLSEYIGNIMEAGTHLKMTVENILHYISLENIDAKLHLEQLHKEEMEEILEPLFDQIFRKSKNEYTYTIDDDFKSIQTDKERLMVLLSILIDNANKFTDGGKVKVKIYCKNERAYFEVVDSGIGFDQKILTELSKPFTQSESKRSRKFGGLGLGLSLCKKLIKFLDGELVIESKQNEGTSIKVIIPIN